MSKIIKEIIIMLLICLISMLIFAIIFYEYIPNRKVVAEVTNYSTSEEIETLLADDIDSKENEVVLTYEVSADDLSSYEVTNDYVPGKADPFAAYADDAEENTSNETTTNNATGNTSSSGQVEKPENEVEENNSFIDDGGLK